MISVCLALYNGEKYIAGQVSSIMTQLGERDELIISDDGSTDKSVDIINGFADGRIKLVRNSGLHGVNSNFENALKHASGDFIFLSDQDNVWLPGKLKACVEALGEADLVVHDAIITDSELNAKNKSLFDELIIKDGFLNNFIKNRFSGCCMAMRRELLDRVIPIPRSTLFYYDNWIGLNAILKGKVRFIPYKGIMLRRHGEVLSSVGGASGLSLRGKLASRLSLLYAIARSAIASN